MKASLKILAVLGCLSPTMFFVPVHAAQGLCGTQSFHGTYAYSYQGTFLPGQPQETALVEIGVINADGHGGLTGNATASLNGAIADLSFAGTYEMSSDCRGSSSFSATIDFRDPSIPDFEDSNRSVDFVLAGFARNQVRLISTSPGSVLTGTATKQWYFGTRY